MYQPARLTAAPLRLTAAALLLALLTLCNVAAKAAEPSQRIDVANFASASEQHIFANWRPYQFSLLGRNTHYQLVPHNGHKVMRAVSDKAASGLIRALPIQIHPQLTLNWRWKITDLPKGADDQSKAGDDFSVRLYVIFSAPETSLMGWIKTATGFGETHALKGTSNDYRRAFGSEPPPVSAIAIMTDSDNTGSSLTSYYGDIYFSNNDDQVPPE